MVQICFIDIFLWFLWEVFGIWGRGGRLGLVQID